MNRAYWDALSANYEREVLSVFDEDREGRVRRAIVAAGKAVPGGSAADLGCGVGKFTSALADAFATVEACDFSATALEHARARCAAYANVRFHNVDLTSEPVPFDPVDFALCVNALIMPGLDERLRAWRAVTNQVASGGALLLVAPSLESAQMAVYREIDARLDDGASPDEAQRLSHAADSTARELQQGVRRLGDQRAKHYLREELREMLEAHHFEVESVTKLVYSADGDETWDWLALARRAEVGR